MHKYNPWQARKDGFVLPTVLIVSVIMLSALTLSLSIVWSSRQSLKEQFDTQNARNAAISGTNVAEGCRYGNILISDTITASSSPLGTRDCGMTSATASINPFILRPEYGNALTSFGFSATFLKDASGSPVSVSSTSGAKGKSSTAFARQGQLRATNEVFFVPVDPSAVYPSMQDYTLASCPTTPTVAKDIGSGRLYAIKGFVGNGTVPAQCWMVTNLYSTWTPPLPTNGIGLYGSLYAWSDATSACPSGWVLPTSADVATLNTLVNGGKNNTDIGLRQNWFGVYGGRDDGYGVINQGNTGGYWTSSSYSTTHGYLLLFSGSSAYAPDIDQKDAKFSVRCMKK